LKVAARAARTGALAGDRLYRRGARCPFPCRRPLLVARPSARGAALRHDAD
jgi:hypothetical protein